MRPIRKSSSWTVVVKPNFRRIEKRNVTSLFTKFGLVLSSFLAGSVVVEESVVGVSVVFDMLIDFYVVLTPKLMILTFQRFKSKCNRENRSMRISVLMFEYSIPFQQRNYRVTVFKHYTSFYGTIGRCTSIRVCYACLLSTIFVQPSFLLFLFATTTTTLIIVILFHRCIIFTTKPDKIKASTVPKSTRTHSAYKQSI